MAIEEEFSIEIPDKEADAIHSGMSGRYEKRAHANNHQLTRLPPTSAHNPTRTKGCGTAGEREKSKTNDCTFLVDRTQRLDARRSAVVVLLAAASRQISSPPYPHSRSMYTMRAVRLLTVQVSVDLGSI